LSPSDFPNETEFKKLTRNGLVSIGVPVFKSNSENSQDIFEKNSLEREYEE